MSFPEGMLLADKSAWQRAGHPSVRDDWVAALRAGRIVVSLPVRYALLYSARDARAFKELESQLASLREVAITATVQRAALGAMRELASAGRHRVPLPDLLIAAAAQEHGVTVLHQDRHFDTLQRVMTFVAHRLIPERGQTP
jgi:predicted nucleic acid-binding protein